ncbi:hypothetical protein SAMN04488508_102465 [Aquimarina spongiae]|uniref:Uncharacterized protein n=2 Tax=Aquimarina spongiae TaxID=570521 RepID=A0A1M6D712_9FLAO|nr:hypothetical protein SAMN04488508_102465 [Aquimarina spongiae]
MVTFLGLGKPNDEYGKQKTHPMKKLIVLGFAVLCICGIQSCSIDEQEDIAPQKIATTENKKTKAATPLECRKTIYVNFGDSMSSADREQFRIIAKHRWYNSILVAETLCSRVEVWEVPCARVSNPRRNDEGKNIVVDAEESVATLNDGGSAQPPYLYPAPKLEPNNFNLIVCTTPPNPIIITDGDEDDDIGDNPIGIPLR